MFPLTDEGPSADSAVFPRPRKLPAPRPEPSTGAAMPAPPSFPVPVPVFYAALPPDPRIETRQAESFRAFAVIALLVAVATSSLVASILLLVAVDLHRPAPVVPAALPPRVVVHDEEVEAPLLAAEVPVRSAVPGPRPSTPREPPPPPTTPAPVTVTLAPGSPPFTSFSVTCASTGFRQVAPLSGGTGTLADVPRADCVLHFRGVGALPKTPVTGGRHLTCSFVGTAPDCR